MSKTLVLAEKKSAGLKYADFLNCNNKNKGYREGDDYIVSWARGHLFTLKEPADYNKKYEKWSYNKLPIIPNNFDIKLNKNGKYQYNIIKKLINRNDVTTIINGGDAGREGELIQRYILNKANKDNKPVKRLWISELTKKGIEKGFNNLKPQSKYNNLYHSAKARAIIDWLIGINYTRAYSTLNKGDVTIIVGRVQTAILSIIDKRQEKINDFTPKKYNEIISNFGKYKGKYIDENNNSKLFSKKEVNKIKNNCKNKKGKISKIEKKKKSKKPPKLFDLTSLQKRMNKKYNFTSKQTLNIAQKLYDKHNIITYPRTESKYLGNSHKEEIPKIFKNLKETKHSQKINKLELENLKFTKRFIDDSKLSDHHAIIPTTKKDISKIYKKLNRNEQLLFDEVVYRLLVQFYDDYIYTTTTIFTDVKEHTFKTKGKIINSSGWKKVYPDKNSKDNKLPEVNKGEEYKVKKIIIKDKKTKPPKKYTENTLLSKMEKYNVGTNATRADTIEKLLSNKYIKRKKNKLLITATGKKVIDTIITDIKNPKFTGKLEDKLTKIKEGKINKDKVIKNQIFKLKKDIKKIGSETIKVNSNRKEKEPVCECPKCDDGKIYKRKSFYSCSNWNNDNNKCNFTINKIAGKLLTKNQVKRLCEKKETKFLRGFKSKKGNKFKAKVILKKDYDIDLKFPKRDTEISCPKCNEGKMIDKGKFYGCSNYPDCNFTVSKKIAGKKLTKNQLKNLCKNDKTNKINGFKSKKGKTFSARLKLDDKYKTQFDFN